MSLGDRWLCDSQGCGNHVSDVQRLQELSMCATAVFSARGHILFSGLFDGWLAFAQLEPL